jgi:lysyl-tRNA synthetase class 2
MRLRIPSPESALAWAAAAVGVIGIVSALTPEMADRVRIINGVVPPGLPEAARVLALAFGAGLVFLSRSLARRRRRAWQLAVAVVIASAIAHLAKGLDFEEAAISLLLLAALIRWRRRFDVPGDPRSVRPLLALGAVSAAAGAILVSEWLRGNDLPDHVSDVLTAGGLLVAGAALYLWLRPLGHVVVQTVAEQRVARALVDAYGTDSLSFFALRRDKSYLFSPTRGAFLAYRVVSGTALVSGDPVGDESELDALLGELLRLARARGWRVAVVGASEERLELYRRHGLRGIAMGEEAVLRPGEFSLEGRAIRKVRQSATRMEKAGYRFRAVTAEQADAALLAELDAVSDEWRGGRPERGFSMAMDELDVHGTVFAVAEGADGRVGGFLHLAPSTGTGSGGGWSLSTMRRRRHAPNGLTEFLIVETLAWAKSEGASELSLNFCALTDFLAHEKATTPLRRLLRRGLLAADNVFQLERLYAFNRKFFPEWRRRYICVERLTDLPAVGLAYLHVESLLPMPRKTQPTARL